MHSIHIPWPGVRLYARDCGEVDPYLPQNLSLFRGEEAFAADTVGWKRWSKPSPEPQLDAGFEQVLLDSIKANAALIQALTRELSERIVNSFEKAPVLVAILRAGVPICALIAPLLQAHYGEEVPICAMSLFYGLGWDEVALQQIVDDFPDRPLLFVDGWTSGGGVATQLKLSFEQWISAGKRDFTNGHGPQFAVLCDPRAKATFSAIRADYFVPSAAFTAPETLGFSRGFAFENGELFGVYSFPIHYQKPRWIAEWMNVLQSANIPLPLQENATQHKALQGMRVDLNEVTRSLINRTPLEIWLRVDEAEGHRLLSPLIYLARSRHIPIRFGCEALRQWGTSAVARMS